MEMVNYSEGNIPNKESGESTYFYRQLTSWRYMRFTSNHNSMNTPPVRGIFFTAKCILECGHQLLFLLCLLHQIKTNYMIDFIHAITIIKSGDLNVNFTRPEAQPLIYFLDSKLKLKPINNRTISSQYFIDN